MKLNDQFWKRESTWMNIAECVIAVVIQLSINLPKELNTPLWLYIGLRLFMGFVQGVKKSERKN